MELIKEIGANGIRLAHYPHSDFSIRYATGKACWYGQRFL